MKFWVSLLSLVAVASADLPFTPVGDASVDPDRDGCFRLTEDKLWQEGAVWSSAKVDLTKCFEIETSFYVGNRNNGADGIALVFQKNGVDQLGGKGERKGYFNIKGALAIEVDTYRNHPDPFHDFVQIASTGPSGVDRNDDLKVLGRQTLANMENGRVHHMRVVYNSGTNTFQVYINNQKKLETTLPNPPSYYVGASTAYFGYTSATGSARSLHYVCPNHPIVVCGGDPHFKTWTGEKFDFHGVCDLVLLQNAKLDNGESLDIHIRTHKSRMWSLIHTAAVRVGVDVLEVMGGKDENRFWVNKQRGQDVDNIVLSGRPVTFTQLSDKSRQFDIQIGSGASIRIKTWNGMVSVIMNVNNGRYFTDSRGLVGAYPSGAKLARDNTTEIADANIFGQEWQVLPTDPDLFHDIDGPQYPAKCDIPASSQMRRRLGESVISKQDAELACARVNPDDFDICVFDVMATNDKDSAGAF
jgi:hypothetical protein